MRETDISARHWENRKTVLVTGGCGFIGSALVRQLIFESNAKVIILDSLRYGRASNLGDTQQSVEVVRFDLGRDDPAEIRTTLKDVTHVFHLAAEKSNQLNATPHDIFRSNIEGMHDLLQMLCDLSLQKVLFTSSLFAYGRTSGPPLTETDVPKPMTTYGISKLAGEHLLSHFKWKYGLGASSVRLFFTYGPRQFAGLGYKSVIVKNFERILRGENPIIFGDGLQEFDYIYVDDVVNALVMAMSSTVELDGVNVGSGIGTNILDLTTLILDVAKSNLEPKFGPADWTANSSRVANPSLLERQLGWRAETPIQSGLAKTLEWMKEHLPV